MTPGQAHSLSWYLSLEERCQTTLCAHWRKSLYFATPPRVLTRWVDYEYFKYKSTWLERTHDVGSCQDPNVIPAMHATSLSVIKDCSFEPCSIPSVRGREEKVVLAIALNGVHALLRSFLNMFLNGKDRVYLAPVSRCLTWGPCNTSQTRMQIPTRWVKKGSTKSLWSYIC